MNEPTYIIGTATIQIEGTSEHPIDEGKLRKLKDALTDSLSATLDRVLIDHGIDNEQIHSCLIEDLSIDG